ncbi:hypothetical protein BDV96DRAFT_112640 [Lophiotrema nucula]|uniref:Uncharacterized protein n=1 Tax=Lophiotrema nucula TaxID=690887 RepID=A0A6A5Z4E9_9PLEO|nr:hypothetical protein BDV96DRAFT_112640 [Lophiotrema nucula]
MEVNSGSLLSHMRSQMLELLVFAVDCAAKLFVFLVSDIELGRYGSLLDLVSILLLLQSLLLFFFLVGKLLAETTFWSFSLLASLEPGLCSTSRRTRGLPTVPSSPRRKCLAGFAGPPHSPALSVESLRRRPSVNFASCTSLARLSFKVSIAWSFAIIFLSPKV